MLETERKDLDKNLVGVQVQIDLGPGWGGFTGTVVRGPVDEDEVLYYVRKDSDGHEIIVHIDNMKVQLSQVNSNWPLCETCLGSHTTTEHADDEASYPEAR